MKTTVLTAALLAAFAMPAFAEDAIKTDDTARMTTVDPVTTNSTTGQSDMEKAAKDGYSGCMHRKTTAQMM
ncbi:MAG: hypothetical protein JWL86_983 [Rhizobium sp.]|nr:hypothetical protein [Rhizobium sp.]